MEENNNANTGVPIGALMDAARQEILEHTNQIMENNGIPPDLISYILDSVGKTLCQSKAEMYSIACMTMAQKNSDVKKEE